MENLEEVGKFEGVQFVFEVSFGLAVCGAIWAVAVVRLTLIEDWATFKVLMP